jgi:hypothetical protein
LRRLDTRGAQRLLRQEKSRLQGMGPALREVRLGGGAAVSETWSRQRRSCWTRLGRGSGSRPYEPGLRPITRHRIAAPSTGSRLEAVVRLARPSVRGHPNQPFDQLQDFGTGTVCFHAGRSLSNGLEPLKIIIDGTSPRPAPKLSTVSSTSHECASEMRGTR